MTHRIAIGRAEGIFTIDVEGVVDGNAIADIRDCLAAKPKAAAARVLLRSGATVDRQAIAALRGLGVTLAAESPYLAHWLGDAEPEPGSVR